MTSARIVIGTASLAVAILVWATPSWACDRVAFPSVTLEATAVRSEPTAATFRVDVVRSVNKRLGTTPTVPLVPGDEITVAYRAGGADQIEAGDTYVVLTSERPGEPGEWFSSARAELYGPGNSCGDIEASTTHLDGSPVENRLLRAVRELRNAHPAAQVGVPLLASAAVATAVVLLIRRRRRSGHPAGDPGTGP